MEIYCEISQACLSRKSSPGSDGDASIRTGRIDRRHCHPQQKSPVCPTTGSSCGQAVLYNFEPSGRKVVVNKTGAENALQPWKADRP